MCPPILHVPANFACKIHSISCRTSFILAVDYRILQDYYFASSSTSIVTAQFRDCCPRNFEYLVIAYRVLLYLIAQHRPTLLGICTRVSLRVIQRSSVSFHKRWHNDSTASFATLSKPRISLFLHEYQQ